jgi:IS5 family transposase
MPFRAIKMLANAEQAMNNKRTRREKFLDYMECVGSWTQLIAMIEPQHPTSGRVSRQLIGVLSLLRRYCLQ